MIHSAKATSRDAAILPTSRRSRFGTSLSTLCLATLPALSGLACSAADAPATGTADANTIERNRDSWDSDGLDSSAARGAQGGGSVRLGQPYLSGTCTPEATAAVVADSNRYVTALFHNQNYAGDRDDPDYVKNRTEGGLIGDAKSTAPKCVLHVPMKVTAGYRFSPTNITVRGFAHRAFVFGAYRWANSGSEYTFERQVPLNEPSTSKGDNFVYTEPLHGLWSPTCGKSSSGDVDAELVVTLQPYTASGRTDTAVAIDSFDVAGFGSVEKCSSAPSYDRVAQEGEDCGIVEMDYVHPVRCDTQKQTNICVYPDIDSATGTCVNASRRPAPSELVVGEDEECGGPFYRYCNKDDGLVCRFFSADARQNASSHYGRCVPALPVGAECNTALFGACNGNSCNTTVDPCEAGATCKNGKCAAAKVNSRSPQAD